MKPNFNYDSGCSMSLRSAGPSSWEMYIPIFSVHKFVLAGGCAVPCQGRSACLCYWSACDITRQAVLSSVCPIQLISFSRWPNKCVCQSLFGPQRCVGCMRTAHVKF